MYRTTNAMGFSLKPPDWLQKLIGGATGGAVKVVNPLQPNAPEPTPTFLNIGQGDMPSWVLPVGIGAVVLFLVMRKGR